MSSRDVDSSFVFLQKDVKDGRSSACASIVHDCQTEKRGMVFRVGRERIISVCSGQDEPATARPPCSYTPPSTLAARAALVAQQAE